jgi:hypothetical protein
VHGALSIHAPYPDTHTDTLSQPTSTHITNAYIPPTTALLPAASKKKYQKKSKKKSSDGLRVRPDLRTRETHAALKRHFYFCFWDERLLRRLSVMS